MSSARSRFRAVEATPAASTSKSGEQAERNVPRSSEVQRRAKPVPVKGLVSVRNLRSGIPAPLSIMHCSSSDSPVATGRHNAVPARHVQCIEIPTPSSPLRVVRPAAASPSKPNENRGVLRSAMRSVRAAKGGATAPAAPPMSPAPRTRRDRARHRCAVIIQTAYRRHAAIERVHRMREERRRQIAAARVQTEWRIYVRRLNSQASHETFSQWAEDRLRRARRRWQAIVARVLRQRAAAQRTLVRFVRRFIFLPRRAKALFREGRCRTLQRWYRRCGHARRTLGSVLAALEQLEFRRYEHRCRRVREKAALQQMVHWFHGLSSWPLTTAADIIVPRDRLQEDEFHRHHTLQESAQPRSPLASSSNEACVAVHAATKLQPQPPARPWSASCSRRTVCGRGCKFDASDESLVKAMWMNASAAAASCHHREVLPSSRCPLSEETGAHSENHVRHVRSAAVAASPRYLSAGVYS